MSRWSPEARNRLQAAALELFAERGYTETTVAAVAERAGLTERTFFRYFTDKKEVLFAEDPLGALVVAAITASAGPSALDLAVDGFRAAAAYLQADAPQVRRRAAVIAVTPELQEREMLKMSRWTAMVTETLQADQVEPRAARIAAEVSTALFRIAYDMWIDGSEVMGLVTLLDELLGVLQSVSETVPRR